MLAARIPYFRTHYIQEDSYITFRTAFHLADNGTFSYNLGDHVTGVTSVLYGLFVALMRFLFRGAAIDATLTLLTIFFLAGAVLLAKTLFRNPRQQLAFFALVSLLPVAFRITTAGMEIPLQVFAVCWALYLLRYGNPRWPFLIPVLLLPLIRPDAIAFALLLALLAFTFRWVYGVIAAAAAIAGSALVLVFNKAVSGSFVPITMRAKEISYHPSHSAAAILHRLGEVFVSSSFTSLVETPLFFRLGILCFLLFVTCGLVAIRQRESLVAKRILATMLAAGVLIPLCYVAGGIIFGWYLWTSAWLLSSFACYQLVVWMTALSAPPRRVAVTATVLVWGGLAAIQWVLSFNKGIEEYEYRASVGRLIGRLALPGDSLLLEPAGYIPFFAKIHTDDEIGLVSEPVLDYRMRDGNAWFMDYLKQQSPTFLVERGYLLQHQTVDNANISAADWSWFSAHYRLLKHFRYNAADYTHNPFLLRIIRNSYQADYLLFERSDRAQ